MVYYGGVLVANSDLYHHGILGQKWGKRNGPPYPLSAGAHSAGEKKAGYQKSIKGSGGGSYTGKIDKKTARNRSKAFVEYAKKPKTDERVKYYVNKNTKDIARYQTHHEDVDKKKRTAYEYTYDFKRGTAVGKKKLVQYSKDGKTSKVIKELGLTDDDYKKAEKYIEDRKKEANKNINVNDNTFGNAKEDRKKAKIEKRVREQLAEIKKNNPEQYEKIKKDTIDKGKASEIKYFVDDMNNNELQYVIDRLDKKAKINSLSNRETKTNWDKVKDISDKMKIVADFTNNAANIYNNLSRLAPTEDQNKKK